jgi:predicted MPP superfamily phosphohydrolase
LSRVLGFAVLLCIAGSIVAGVHYYFWARLVRDTQLTGVARNVASATIAGLAVLVIATPLTGRLWPRVGGVLAWPGFVWMGAMFILLVALLGLDVVRLLVSLGAHVFHPTPVVDESRRRFTMRVLGGAALLGTGSTVAAAVMAALGRISVKRVEVALDKLPPSLDGTTIALMSDLHIGGLLGRGFVERVVAITNDLHPDVIAIAGDLVDGTIERLRPALAPLRELRARHGTYFVTGNHEYYTRSGVRAWMDELSRMGIQVLCNRRVSIGSDAASFDLAGVPDHHAGRFPDDGPPENVEQALDGRDASRAVVLLAHQPKTFEAATRLGVDLQLSGHTHGGQIWPWGALVRLQQPFVRGLHRVGTSQIYVTCGTGFWGPPMRLGAPAEITTIVLRSVQRSA